MSAVLSKSEITLGELKRGQTAGKGKLSEIYALKKTLKGLGNIKPEDLTVSIINFLIDNIYATPVDERHLSLKIV